MLTRLPNGDPDAVRSAAPRHASRAARMKAGRGNDVMLREVGSLPVVWRIDGRGVLHVSACRAATLLYWMTKWNG
ncbi:hypothetical protein [Burkholderia ambifaria]|uniref:hypothetical protein n=1 Tax=Burkholderia ambifaria TaxID=152480 RepID=UPI002FE0675E